MESTSTTFDHLWAQMHDPLCRFVCSRITDPQDAEDVLQDVFVRAFQQLGTVRDPERVESWLYQIARHRIIDLYRARRAWVALPETLPLEEELDDSIAADLAPHLQGALRSLAPRDQQALILADVHGLAQQDLAARAGISLSGAKSRVQRARQKVKAALLHCFVFERDRRGGVLDYRALCCC